MLKLKVLFKIFFIARLSELSDPWAIYNFEELQCSETHIIGLPPKSNN